MAARTIATAAVTTEPRHGAVQACSTDVNPVTIATHPVKPTPADSTTSKAEQLVHGSGCSVILGSDRRSLFLAHALDHEHERTVALQAMVTSLTKRESVVFGLVVRGKRNKQIAYELGTSESTVKAHRRSIMEKLNARSLAEVVSIAERLGLLSEPPPA